MRLNAWYVIRRCIVFLIVIFVAATINFILPRMAPGDPIQTIIGNLSRQGVRIEGGEEIIQSYREMFGLDESLFTQYLKYIKASFQLDMGYSIRNFPARVLDLILRAIPWTIGLLSVAILISFALGIFLGALLGWTQGNFKSNLFAKLIPLFMVLGAIPYYLVSIGLLYIFSYTLGLFPARGATSIGTIIGFDLSSILDILYHATLPALSIVLTDMGYWALGMRGMTITIVGEDYLSLAEAKGLSTRRIFWRYAVRNAVLPQTTALIMSLGLIASGTLLVEIMFSYPGIGFLMYKAIANNDYPVIQGTTFFLVLSVALAVLILDLIYPWLDPRITYTGR